MRAVQNVPVLFLLGHDRMVDGLQGGDITGGKNVVMVFDDLFEFLGVEPFTPAIRTNLDLNAVVFHHP